MKRGRNRLARAAAVAAIALAAPTAACAGAILTAGVDRDTIRVGDPVVLTLRLDSTPGDSARFPDFPPGGDSPFSLIGTDPPEEKTIDGVKSRVLRLHITAWKPGDYAIPPLEPVGGGEASEEIPITVLSVGLDEGGDLRNVKDPVTPGRNIVFLLAPWAALALLAAIAAWLYMRRKRRASLADPSFVPIDLRPAHEIALEAIDRAEKEWETEGGVNGRAQIHFYILSRVIREYIRNRYALPAPERTSREILREIRREKLPPETIPLLRELLLRCDEVKYRGGGGEDDLFPSLIGKSRRFVERTRESRESPAEGKGTA